MPTNKDRRSSRPGVLTAVYGAALFSLCALAAAQQQTPPANKGEGAVAPTPKRTVQAPLADWQRSHSKFIGAVAAWVSSGKETPAGTILALAEGQDVPNKWEIMKAYGKNVEWEGVFQGAKEKGELAFDFGKPGEVVVEFFYSKPSALDSWKKINKGTAVLLKGSVTGIAANKMPFRGETLTTFVVTVRNVELVKELTTPESGKEKQVE